MLKWDWTSHFKDDRWAKKLNEWNYKINFKSAIPKTKDTSWGGLFSALHANRLNEDDDDFKQLTRFTQYQYRIVDL